MLMSVTERRSSYDRMNYYLIVLLISLAVCIRLISVILTYHFHKEGIVFSYDSYGYENAALAILKTGNFTTSITDLRPEIMRPPGYPLFLALIYRFFGHNNLAVSILQMIMTIILIFLVTDICKKIYDSYSTYFAAFILAIDMLSIRISQYLLTETLFTLLLVISVWVSTSAMVSRKWTVKDSLSLGILLSLATMVRPITYYIIIPIILCCFYQLRSLLYNWKKSLFLILLLIIPWLSIIGGWQIRNYINTGIGDFSTIQSINLFYYRGAAVLAEKENISLEKAQKKLELSLPDSKTISQSELNKLQSHIGIQLIIKNPLIYTKIFLRGLLTTLLGPGSTGLKIWLPNKTLASIFLGISLFGLILCYLGFLFWILMIQNEKNHFVAANITIWCIIIYVLLVGSGGESYSRFRIPVMPFIALYGGHGLALAYQKYVRGARGV